MPKQFWDPTRILKIFRHQVAFESEGARLRHILSQEDFSSQLLVALEKASWLHSIEAALSYLETWLSFQTNNFYPPLPFQEFWKLLADILVSEYQSNFSSLLSESSDLKEDSHLSSSFGTGGFSREYLPTFSEQFPDDITEPLEVISSFDPTGESWDAWEERDSPFLDTDDVDESFFLSRNSTDESLSLFASPEPPPYVSSPTVELIAASQRHSIPKKRSLEEEKRRIERRTRSFKREPTPSQSDYIAPARRVQIPKRRPTTNELEPLSEKKRTSSKISTRKRTTPKISTTKKPSYGSFRSFPNVSSPQRQQTPYSPQKSSFQERKSTSSQIEVLKTHTPRHKIPKRRPTLAVDSLPTPLPLERKNGLKKKRSTTNIPKRRKSHLDSSRRTLEWGETPPPKKRKRELTPAEIHRKKLQELPPLPDKLATLSSKILSLLKESPLSEWIDLTSFELYLHRRLPQFATEKSVNLWPIQRAMHAIPGVEQEEAAHFFEQLQKEELPLKIAFVPMSWEELKQSEERVKQSSQANLEETHSSSSVLDVKDPLYEQRKNDIIAQILKILTTSSLFQNVHLQNFFDFLQKNIDKCWKNETFDFTPIKKYLYQFPELPSRDINHFIQQLEGSLRFPSS